MKNHWLDIKRNKDIHGQLDDIFMDVWGKDGVLGDSFDAMTREQIRFLRDYTIEGVESEEDKLVITIKMPGVFHA